MVLCMTGVRKHGGIAWFPIFNGSDELEWIANPMYDSSHLICKSPSDYISLDIRKRGIYLQTIRGKSGDFLICA